MSFRSAFFGTPEFAVPIMEAACEVSELVAVVCQPDRRGGRGMKLQAPAVKRAAMLRDIPVHQPTRVRDGSLQRWLEQQRVEVAIVAAYGRILPRGVLDVPRVGCINLHASLLPAYRGAAPIERAIMAGEQRSGVSLMQMDEGMDTGPVFAVRSTEISREMTGAELRLCLSNIAAAMVRDELVAAVAGKLTAVPQATDGVSAADPLTRADFAIDFSRPAGTAHDLVRALAPQPGAEAFMDGARIKVLRSRVAEQSGGNHEIGMVRVEGGRAFVMCADAWLELLELKLAGRPARSARDLINGRSLRSGLILEAHG